MLKTSSINLILRMITLGSKFLLMIAMTKYLSPSDVGIYGIISTSIGLSIYFVGLDFYTFNTREILSNKNYNAVVLIRDQFTFHLLSYLIFFPLLIILFTLEIIPFSYIFVFYLLLFLEHLSQELNRVFVTLSKPIVANITLFFRSGAWAYAAILLFFTSENTRDIWTVLYGWVLGVFISIVLSAYYLKDLKWRDTFKVRINWLWIKRGVIISFPLFIGNIAVKLMEYLDRYFLTYFKGKEVVGAYTFYGSIANLLVVFTQTGIMMILTPKIIKSYQNGHFDKYKSNMKKMSLGIIFSTLILILILVFGIYLILDIIGNEIYKENLPAFWILMIGYAFSVFSLIPHQALYVRHMDKEIIISGLMSLGVSIICNVLLVNRYGIIGAATSTLISFISLLLFKFLFLLRIRSK